jgi:hypothetical protein
LLCFYINSYGNAQFASFWFLRCSCGFLSRLCMLPHPHGGVLCMELCWACGGNVLCHTASGAGKQCKTEKQPPPIAILWCPVNRPTHIKRETSENQNLSAFAEKGRPSKTGSLFPLDGCRRLMRNIINHTGNLRNLVGYSGRDFFQNGV